MRYSKEQMVQGTAGVLLVALCGAVYLVHPEFYARLWQMATCADMAEMVTYLRSFGAWAMVVSFLVDVLINALGFLPSIFVSTANGLVFGIVPGVILSWLAETVGVVISFFLMRTILRDSAERIIQKSKRLTNLDKKSGESGFKFMLIARTVPYFPSGLLTAIGAVSRISVRDYILANLIGKFPSTAIEVIIGHDLVRYEENMMRLAIVATAAIIVYGSLWWRDRKKSRARA